MPDQGLTYTDEAEVILEDIEISGAHNALVITRCARVRLLRPRCLDSKSGAIWLIDCPDVEIIEPHIDGAGDPSEHAADCITGINVGRFILEGGYLARGSHGGILLRRNAGLAGERIIRGVNFGPMYGSLLTIAEGYHGCLIERNLCRGAPTAAQITPGALKAHGRAVPHDGIQLHGDNHIVRDNRFVECGQGLYISCSEVQTARAIAVYGNLFDLIDANAIEFQFNRNSPEGAMDRNLIQKNDFRKVGGDVLHMAWPGAPWGGTKILGNRIEASARVFLGGWGRTTIGGAQSRFPATFASNWPDAPVDAPLSDPVPDPMPDPTPPPPPVPFPEPPPPPAPDPEPAFAAPHDRIFADANEARAEYGAPLLVRNALLDKAAQETAESWAAKGWWNTGHVGPDGSTWQQRIARAGYRQDVSLATACEIGARWGSAQSVVDHWVVWGFDTHGKHLVNPAYRECGVGYAEGPDGTRLFMTFGIGQQGVPAPEPTPEPKPGLPAAFSLTPERALPGETVTLRGERFGAQGGRLAVKEQGVFPVTWSETAIRFLVPALPEGPAFVTLIRADGQTSNILTLLVEAPPPTPEPEPPKPPAPPRYRPPGRRVGVPSGGL